MRHLCQWSRNCPSGVWILRQSLFSLCHPRRRLWNRASLLWCLPPSPWQSPRHRQPLLCVRFQPRKSRLRRQWRCVHGRWQRRRRPRWWRCRWNRRYRHLFPRRRPSRSRVCSSFSRRNQRKWRSLQGLPGTVRRHPRWGLEGAEGRLVSGLHRAVGGRPGCPAGDGFCVGRAGVGG